MTDCTTELQILKAKYSVLESKLERLLSAFAALSSRISQSGPSKSEGSTDSKSTIGHMGEAASVVGKTVGDTLESTFGETIGSVKDRAGEVGETLSGTIDDMQETASSAFEGAKDTTRNLHGMLTSRLNEATEAVGDMFQKAKEEGDVGEEGEKEKGIFGGKKKKTRRAKSQKPKKKTRKAKKCRGKRR